MRVSFFRVVTTWLTLASLSTAWKLAWEDPSGDSIFDAYEGKAPPKDAVEAWVRYKEPHPEYFNLTQLNLDDSGVAEWYPKYIDKQRENKPQYKNLGEVPFFATVAWGDPNFMCGMIHKGCNTVPTSKAVIDTVMNHREGRNYTVGENLAEARRIYFMAMQMNGIAQLFYYQSNLFNVVKSNALHSVENIVVAFTQQPEIEADHICQILILSYSTLLEIGKTVMNSFGKVPESISNFVMMSEAVTEMTLNTALESGASVTGGGQNLAPPVDESEWSLEQKEKYVKAKITNAKVGQMLMPFQKLAVMGVTKAIEDSHSANAAAESQLGEEDKPWLDMAGRAATGFCSGLGGGFNNENAQRSNRLKQYILEAFPQIKGALQNNLDAAVHWTGNGTSSPFASWVGKCDWSIQNQHRNLKDDEERATQLYVDSLISVAWRSAKCYQKCVCDPKIDLEKYRNPKERTTKYRYFPKDENCVCQPQCWSATRRSPYEKRLFGLNKLGKYGHNITDISSMSYNYYRANGNRYRFPNMDLRYQASDAEAGISLPHCVSKQIQIGDFDDESANHKAKLLRNNNRRFPCTCGNWQSNETEIFMDIFAMGNGQGWMKSHAGDELYKQVCTENLKALTPLSQYLAYCKLGIRWPYSGEMMYAVLNQTDKHCGDISNYYSSWIDNEREANKHFCTRNKIAKDIFKSQRAVPTIETGLGQRAVAVEPKCRAWLRKEETKGKNKDKIMVPIELYAASEMKLAMAKNGTNGKAFNGSGVYETIILDDGTEIMYEESADQVTVDFSLDEDGEATDASVNEEASTATLPTTILTKEALAKAKATTSASAKRWKAPDMGGTSSDTELVRAGILIE